jgi:hypothetical protein
MVVRTLMQNTEVAQKAVEFLLANLDTDSDCDCRHALKDAVITQPGAIPPAIREKVSLLVDKYLPPSSPAQ